jgi:lysine 2,3-aminomutase
MSKVYPKVEYRSIPLFRDVAEDEWSDWHWQLRNAIRDVETLEQVIELTDVERENLPKTLQKFRMAITPYYAALMDRDDPRCPVRLQAVPRIEELHVSECDLADPLHEDVDSPTPGLTHRYPDRVLLLVSNECSMYCRHCTRRRLVGDRDVKFSQENVDAGIAYVRENRNVRDVLLSGGDPLVLGEERLEYVLRELRSIDHVEIVRIGTRTPVVMPQRITDELVEMLRRYHPLYINTHFNTPKEVTLEAKVALDKLADAGIPLGNQSVLLRGVNDCPGIMKKLVHELLMVRVRPYYIYQCDLSMGISHFRTSVAKGIEIIENLRGHTSGLAVPTFVIDAPGGGGKIPIGPTYLLAQSDRKVVLRNYEGVITTYTQPEDTSSDCGSCVICQDPRFKPLDGVAKLLEGEKSVLEPKGLKRIQRHDWHD